MQLHALATVGDNLQCQGLKKLLCSLGNQIYIQRGQEEKTWNVERKHRLDMLHAHIIVNGKKGDGDM